MRPLIIKFIQMRPLIQSIDLKSWKLTKFTPWDFWIPKIIGANFNQNYIFKIIKYGIKGAFQ